MLINIQKLILNYYIIYLLGFISGENSIEVIFYNNIVSVYLEID